MVSSAARTVDEYLASLPPSRRSAIETVRSTILANIPPGYDEAMLWGMITYSVPLSRHPDTYNGKPLCMAGLASQQGYMAVYLTGAYADIGTRLWFEREYRRTGKRMDMGKGCVRFKKLDDLPLELIGQVIARFSVDEFITRYEMARAAHGRHSAKRAAAEAAAEKPAAKAAAGRPAAKATAAKVTAKKPAAKATAKKPAAKKGAATMGAAKGAAKQRGARK